MFAKFLDLSGKKKKKMKRRNSRNSLNMSHPKSFTHAPTQWLNKTQATKIYYGGKILINLLVRTGQSLQKVRRRIRRNQKTTEERRALEHNAQQ